MNRTPVTASSVNLGKVIYFMRRPTAYALLGMLALWMLTQPKEERSL